MAVILDIIAAMMIGGVLLMVTTQGIERSLREFVNHNADAIMQAELASMTQTVQEDLRKMGYGIPESQQLSIIQAATTSRLVFLAKQNPNAANADTVEYTTGTPDTTIIIDSPVITYDITRTLRRAGQQPQSTLIGRVINPVLFRYLDQAGNQVADIRSTRMVEVTLVTLNPHVYLDDDVIQAPTALLRTKALKNLWRESYWRQTRVVSRNLRR